MRINDLMDFDPGFSEAVFLGKEAVADTGAPYLVLALAKSKDEDGELCSYLWILEERRCTEDEWQTNRAYLSAEVGREVSINEISIFGFDNKLIKDEEKWISIGAIWEQEDGLLLLQYFLKNGCISEYWKDKEPQQVNLIRYRTTLSGELYRKCREPEVKFAVSINASTEDKLIQKPFYCEYGKYEAPLRFEVRDDRGRTFSIRIKGLHCYDPWQHTDYRELFFSEEEQDVIYRDKVSELLRLCPREKELLLLEYECSVELLPSFYLKEVLDAPFSFEAVLDIPNLCLQEKIVGKERQIVAALGSVDTGRCQGAEVELFSCYFYDLESL